MPGDDYNDLMTRAGAWWSRHGCPSQQILLWGTRGIHCSLRLGGAEPGKLSQDAAQGPQWVDPTPKLHNAKEDHGNNPPLRQIPHQGGKVNVYRPKCVICARRQNISQKRNVSTVPKYLLCMHKVQNDNLWTKTWCLIEVDCSHFQQKTTSPT